LTFDLDNSWSDFVAVLCDYVFKLVLQVAVRVILYVSDRGWQLQVCTPCRTQFNYVYL